MVRIKAIHMMGRFNMIFVFTNDESKDYPSRKIGIYDTDDPIAILSALKTEGFEIVETKLAFYVANNPYSKAALVIKGELVKE